MIRLPSLVATCFLAGAAHAQDFSGPYWHEEEQHRAFVCSHADKTVISLEHLDQGVGLYITVDGPQPQAGTFTTNVLALWHPNGRARSGYDSTDFNSGALEIAAVAQEVVKGSLNITLRGRAYRVGFGARFLGGLPAGIDCDREQVRRFVQQRSWSASTKEAVLTHRPRVGMTAEMVHLAIGYPLAVRRREAATAITERWIYSTGLEITFTGRRVTAIDFPLKR